MRIIAVSLHLITASCKLNDDFISIHPERMRGNE